MGQLHGPTALHWVSVIDSTGMASTDKNCTGTASAARPFALT